MNKIHKLIFACFVGLLMTAAPAKAQNGDSCSTGCPTFSAKDFQANKACWLPSQGTMVVIDSIDNTIDIRQLQDDSLARVAHYEVDNIYKRYDVKDIVRPVDVKIIDNNIVFLATSANDSSYLGILDMKGNLVATYGMSCHSNAFNYVQTPCGKTMLVVMGFSKLGYSVNAFFCTGDWAKLSPVDAYDMNYHRPQQAERILQSDPHGAGLAVVAIMVVFLALVMVAVLIGLYSKIIRNSQERKAKKAAEAEAAKTGTAAASTTSPTSTAGEVYAAIAAAIHLYNEELHDEESSIITIQKSERAWTPWNAKFYNMNQHSTTRRK